MTPRQRLRKLINDPAYTIIPGAYDPLTARLVQVAGFGAVYLTGGGFSRAQGYPDLGLLTMTENLAHISRTVDIVDIPVIADMDTGYGNALNVVRAVREYEKAGVSGFHLEDQVAPKKCGHYEGKQMITTAEMTGKIKAAVDTRRDADMVIIARTDARATEGFEAAAERMQWYLEAGADVAFLEAPESVAELGQIPKTFAKPCMCNIFEGGKTPALPAKQLEEMGFAFGIYPSQTHRAAIFAAQEVLAMLKHKGDTAEMEHRLASVSDRELAVQTARWNEMDQRYAGN